MNAVPLWHTGLVIWCAVCLVVGIVLGAGIVLLTESIQHPDLFKRIWGSTPTRKQKTEPKPTSTLESFCVHSAYCEPSSELASMHATHCPLRKHLKLEGFIS